jgi:hypothetical protein
MFSNWTDEPETRSSRFDGVPASLRWAVLPAAVLWLAATLWAVLRVVLDLLDRAGDLAFSWTTPSAQGSVLSHVLLAVVIAVGPPTVGLAIALSWRRPLKTVLLGACAVVLAVGLILLVTTSDASPAPEHRFCQEHSGGDNECPGD